MTSVAQVGTSLSRVLREDAERAGRESHFVERRSKMSASVFVRTLVFGFLADPKITWEGLSQVAASQGIAISAPGLFQRCTRKAADLLSSVLLAATQVVVCANPVMIPLLRRFAGVFVLDGSVITLPDALSEEWKGCGGRTETTSRSAVKLLVMWDLCHGALFGPVLQDGKVHDRNSVLCEKELPRGALRIADLGFFGLPALRRLGRRGVYFLSRLRADVQVVEEVEDGGEAVSLAAFLAQQHGETVDCSVFLGAKERVPVRLLAHKVSSAVGAERRRKLRKEARREGRTPTKERLSVCDWTVYVTNAQQEKLSYAEAEALYRARWQIEPLFRLWKSQGHVDQWRSENPWRILCEVYAKLLGLLFSHWFFLLGLWRSADRSLTKALQTVRRFALMIVLVLPETERLTEMLRQLTDTLQRGCRQNKRKTHPATWQRLLAFHDRP